jgi:hypothetical protein
VQVKVAHFNTALSVFVVIRLVAFETPAAWRLARGVCSGLRGGVMKAFLNFLRQFAKVNFRDFRTGDDYYAVGFDSAYRNVFVFLSVNRLKSSARAIDAKHRIKNVSAFIPVTPVYLVIWDGIGAYLSIGDSKTWHQFSDSSMHAS